MKQEIYSKSYDGIITNHMVEIPNGQVTLRDDRIKRTWTVEIEPFLLAKIPVTQDLYYAITKKSPGFFKGDKKPVETVSWEDAVTFCNLLSGKEGLPPCYRLGNSSEEIIFDSKATGYRLPSEAEWEYACKAATPETRYGEIDRIAWYKGNSEGTTHHVGMKEPNAWGLYDMLGNVWEWCSDIYDEKVYGTYRIFRGGGWSDEARGCLATNRRRSHPASFKIEDLGFRIAKNLKNK
jgi:formylglycine-generating enzyme required for sulfatase activity